MLLKGFNMLPHGIQAIIHDFQLQKRNCGMTNRGLSILWFHSQVILPWKSNED